MVLQILLSIVVLGAIAAFMAWPLINGVDEPEFDAVRAELGMLELDGLATEGPSGWRRGSG